MSSASGLAACLEAAFGGGGVHLVVVPVDYSENIRVLVDELRAAKPVSDAFSKERISMAASQLIQRREMPT